MSKLTLHIRFTRGIKSKTYFKKLLFRKHQHSAEQKYYQIFLRFKKKKKAQQCTFRQCKLKDERLVHVFLKYSGNAWPNSPTPSIAPIASAGVIKTERLLCQSRWGSAVHTCWFFVGWCRRCPFSSASAGCKWSLLSRQLVGLGEQQ